MLEIAWSQLRRRFTPGLDHGVEQDWYDSGQYTSSVCDSSSSSQFVALIITYVL